MIDRRFFVCGLDRRQRRAERFAIPMDTFWHAWRLAQALRHDAVPVWIERAQAPAAIPVTPVATKGTVQ